MDPLTAQPAPAGAPDDRSQLPDDVVLSSELAAEQRYVDRVYEQLTVATASARNVEAESRARFTSDRSDWLREESGTALFERDAFAYQAARRLAMLDAEHEGLVFGRLDLNRDDKPRYIGRLGVRDDDYEPLVIDWRAPAAEAFYRATSVTPMDVIRRRVLRCRDDKVIGIEDDLLDVSAATDLPVIGEGALMAALSRARGHQMRDIVATIQAEQDEAIRAPYQGITIIAGGPGTGKTVVALHRAAYLLYTHRKRLERGGVLVVGPSELFMNYIERVLPGLGEDSVTLKSTGGLASDVLDFASARDDGAEASAIKGSLRMVELLRRLVNEPLLDAAAHQLRVSIKGEILTLDSPEIARIRKQVLSSRRANQARAAAESALLNALWNLVPDDSPEIDLSELTRDDFDGLITGQASWQLFTNAWWSVLNAEQLLARLADRTLLAKLAGNLLTTGEQAALAESLQHADGYLPHSGHPRPSWSVSDVALLDELVAMVGPEPEQPDASQVLFIDGGDDVAELVTTAERLTDRRDEVDPNADPQNIYSHILVDEVQDISPMQWRALRRRGPQASWTLVGDPAQSSYPDLDETERAVRELIGRAPHRTYRLSTNYRSPAEVFDLAAKVIKRVFPEADLPAAIRSTGIEPRLVEARPGQLASALNAEVGLLVAQVEGTIGIIAPPSLVDEVVQAAGSEPALVAAADRLLVLTALQAKGLEYDGVIVVSPDDIVAESPGRERVLYVDLTRPTQRLVTIDLTDGQPAAWRRALDQPAR